MSHTVREKQKLLNRVRRIRGQVEAVERALEAEAGCAEVMHLIAACRGAINGLLVEVLEDHIETHLTVREPLPDRDGPDAAGELIDIIRSYMK
ncbi:MAG: metal/formaldehyde-sensitive transcriptional repressor [Telmatospirillum sp.]|nr:metal/formaldehyde-sensitive transcriptional repressor [Telmatospirillum sp.]